MELDTEALGDRLGGGGSGCAKRFWLFNRTSKNLFTNFPRFISFLSLSLPLANHPLALPKREETEGTVEPVTSPSSLQPHHAYPLSRSIKPARSIDSHPSPEENVLNTSCPILPLVN